MHIIAGRAARSPLKAPPGRHTRPTLARVREAIFSMLAARLGHDWSGCHVLDGFAGSGALGLEAWSRGADTVTLIERHGATCRIIRHNITQLNAGDACTLIRGALPDTLQRLPITTPFDVILLDPPYGDDALIPTLNTLLNDPLSHDDTLILIEHDSHTLPPWPTTFQVVANKRYGNTGVTLGGRRSKAC